MKITILVDILQEILRGRGFFFFFFFFLKSMNRYYMNYFFEIFNWAKGFFHISEIEVPVQKGYKKSREINKTS